MKELKERLKTVRELLTHAEFIRTHASIAAANEANKVEITLQARAEELEKEIAALKETQTVASHAE